MTHHDCHCTNAPAVTVSGGLEAAARRLAAFHRISWREALNGFVAPAERLHRYRGLRTRMLHGALCTVDCKDRLEDDIEDDTVE